MIIKVTTNRKRINELFDKMIEAEKKTKRWQIKTMRMLYLSRIDGVVGIMRMKVKKFITEKTENYFIAEDHGDEKYIDDQIRTMKEFLDSDSSILKKDQGYNKFKRSESIKKVLRFANQTKKNIVNKGIKTAIGGHSVREWFFLIGIDVDMKKTD